MTGRVEHDLPAVLRAGQRVGWRPTLELAALEAFIGATHAAKVSAGTRASCSSPLPGPFPAVASSALSG
jgi:hypothetical protein